MSDLPSLVLIISIHFYSYLLQFISIYCAGYRPGRASIGCLSLSMSGKPDSLTLSNRPGLNLSYSAHCPSYNQPRFTYLRGFKLPARTGMYTSGLSLDCLCLVPVHAVSWSSPLPKVDLYGLIIIFVSCQVRRLAPTHTDSRTEGAVTK